MVVVNVTKRFSVGKPVKQIHVTGRFQLKMLNDVEIN
jgi:hypothetical protein